MTQRSAAPRLDRLVPADTITALTSISWSWDFTHRAGGALLIAVIFTLLVAKDQRKPVFTFLWIKMAPYFIIDYFLWRPTGQTNRMLWPFLDLTVDYQGFYRPPIAGRPSSRRSPLESSSGSIALFASNPGSWKTFRWQIDRPSKRQSFPPAERRRMNRSCEVTEKRGERLALSGRG